MVPAGHERMGQARAPRSASSSAGQYLHVQAHSGAASMSGAAPQLSAGAAKALARLVVGGGLAVYGATHSLFNVEGGHRAIVFNRVVGIKDTVRGHTSPQHTPPCHMPHAARKLAEMMLFSIAFFVARNVWAAIASPTTRPGRSPHAPRGPARRCTAKARI